MAKFQYQKAVFFVLNNIFKHILKDLNINPPKKIKNFKKFAHFFK